ncbi:MAG: nucleotidyltransferase [Enterovirga sp.]|nr:nucleotidyltransferase [Enterovirga sp.]
MPRVVSLFLPTFPTDRIRRISGQSPSRARSGPSRSGREGGDAPPPEAPTVTAVRDGSRRLIACVDDRAREIGLRPGLTVAHAQASVPGLTVIEADPEADRAALDGLARWCLRYAPVVQADPPDGVLIETEGAAHLLGGEAALLRDLLRRVRGAGFSAHAALADTPGAAWAMARHGGGGIVPPGGTARALDSLPVAALRLPDGTASALHLLGIERIGQLAALSSAHVLRRFGTAPGARLARAFGREPDPLVPLVHKEAARVRVAFAEPLVHPETLAAALADLAAELCRTLEQRGEGLRLLDAVFRRVDGCPLGLRAGTALPTRDPGHCLRLLGERLAEIDPGFGIDEMALVAGRVEPLHERQAETGAMTGAGPEGALCDARALAPLVDRLGIRLGPERVFRAAPVESRVPERSVRRVPALAPATGGSWPAALPRPSRIIDPPEEVRATALLPDYPPVAFVWRRVRHVVRAADGPERVHGEWWRSDREAGEVRDYYRVEDERGRRFWLFRNAPSPDGTRWWLHGRFG